MSGSTPRLGSRFPAWLRAHRSPLVSALGGAVILALLVTIAVVSTGYTAQRMDLDDGSVWVANGSRQVIGRANTQVLQLDTVVASTSSSLEVHQQGRDVLLFDRGNSTVDVVDPATAESADSVPVPPEDTVLHTTGAGLVEGRVVVHATGSGRLWIVPMAEFPDFDATRTPADLNLGAGSVSALQPDGILTAYAPESGNLYRVDAASGAVVDRTWQADVGPADDDFAVTSVGDRWAVLDATTRSLALDGRTVDLSALIGAGDSPVLQQAADTAADGAVYVASSGALVRVPLDGGEPETIVDLAAEGRAGAPAVPIVVAGCVYAAWTTGDVWSGCDGKLSGADGVPASAQLALLANRSNVVLNDLRGGGTWAVQDGNAPISGWEELLATEDDEQAAVDDDDDTPPEYEPLQQPPVAADDDFGARPGRSTVLPVLLNDYDANGDVLAISELTAIPAEVGSLELVGNRRQVLLTLAESATGRVTVGYTISDGRGGSASATVTVEVRSAGENSAPVQVRRTKATVAVGGRVTVETLGDWVDPDGDSLYLASASIGAPDTVTWKPGGELVLASGGGDGERADVAIAVSDGRADGAGTIAVTVRPMGEVPLVAEPFSVFAYAGEEVTVEPLPRVRGGSGSIRLTNVPEKSGMRILPDYEGGTFRLTSEQIGTTYLAYTVGDGATTTTGTVRVDVEAPPDPGRAPIPVPHTAFIRQGGSQSLDVLAADIDPAGGVLLVTGVDDVPDQLRVEVLEQRLLRITLAQPLATPVTFSYRISNGLADATGTVTVIEIPDPLRAQPPIARPDTVTVRVGDAIDLPVLANDEHPDGEPLAVDAELVTPLPSGAGLLFVAQNRLRYLAPEAPGNFTAVYRVNGPDGQWATASVELSVREADVAANNPPVPSTVVTRVLAGESVRIPIPLTGIDPDGDSVQLLGQESNPEKGAVTEVGSDWIEFEAGEYSAGTDTFSYRVVDGLGAQAVGTVRIGISSREPGVRNPVAVEDEVTVRPGRAIEVQVLANDSDPDGETLTLTAVESTTEGGQASTDGSLIRVESPERAGRYGFVYTIENERGGTSSTFLTVIVDPSAPLSRPIAEDAVLGLSDILGRATVDVNVLSGVFFAEGDVSELGLSLVDGYDDGAQLVGGGRVRVEIGDRGRIIPFRVAHPEDPAVTATAFIRVPGFDDALPQLRKGAPRLTVRSGETLAIDLAHYVVAVGGRTVRITDTSTVRATHFDGGSLVAGPSALSYRSAEGYFGPASISFQVTDGDTAADPGGRIATLVLPITVLPRENQPPVFEGGVLELEPGGERTVRLARLTTYPSDDSADLVWTIDQAPGNGFDVTIEGGTMTIRAEASAVKGTASSTVIAVRDSANAGQPGRIALRVVASTRPLASPAADVGVATRGQTTTVDVLANDEAANPFPGTPLRVTDVRGLEFADLPAGVRITPSADRSLLTVDADADAQPEDITLQYEVRDATGDPDRAAWGVVRISVRDRPDAVTNVRATGFADRAITVGFDPGAFNNAEITGFDVTATPVGGGAATTTTCASTTCTVATPGNGPSNAVRISVVAKNAVGASTAAELPEPVWSDVVPPAPAGVDSRSLDHGLRVFWRKPAGSGGSPITYYEVRVAGFTSTRTVSASDPEGTEYSLDVTDPAIPNGVAATIQVSARNGAFGRLTNWNTATASGTPVGAPVAVRTPVASVADSGDNGQGAVTLDWAGAFDGNGAGIGSYYAAIYTGTPPRCVARDDGSRGTDLSVPQASPEFRHMGAATSATFAVPAGQEYRFAVFAYNGQGCTSSGEVTAVSRRPPGTPTEVRIGAPVATGDGRFDATLERVAYPARGGSVSYAYRIAGSGTAYPIAIGDRIVAGGGLYGSAVGIEVQVCESYPEKTLCSGWSTSSAPFTPVDTRPGGLTFAAPETWSWTAAPAGSGYSAVEYSCDGTIWTGMPASGSCTGSTGTFQVRVSTPGGGGGANSYLSPVYASSDFD
ncbi:MAG: tandem-95 repeat protein [Naasia sp.]|nr:tandem-95 repeat protein [Naasia sp.]